MFGKGRGWLGRLFGETETERHYRKAADDQAERFQNLPEPGPEEDEVQEPNLELVEFGEASEDIEYMTYNHDTNEVIIQFKDHGVTDRAYAYPDVPYELFERLRDGKGPFPKGRDPHYLKAVSTGQVANYYLRNDHRDDLYPFEEINIGRR